MGLEFLDPGLKFVVSDFGFRVSSFGIRVPGFGFTPRGLRAAPLTQSCCSPVFGFTVSGLRFRVLYFRFRVTVWGLGFHVYCFGFRVHDLGFGIWGSGFGVWGSQFRVNGFGFRVSQPVRRGSGGEAARGWRTAASLQLLMNCPYIPLLFAVNGKQVMSQTWARSAAPPTPKTTHLFNPAEPSTFYRVPSALNSEPPLLTLGRRVG